MKKVIIVLLVCMFICLNLSSCKKTEEKSLSQSNITDYVNIQLVFGDVVQNTFKNSSLYPTTQTSTTYSSCMCYVIVSPKAEYKFENASLTFNISQSLFSSYQTWKPIFDDDSTLLISGQETIFLDKNGYGIASVYFEATGNEHHPSISYEWKPRIINANGKIVLEE
jgi:hypothetical protein